LHEFDHLGQQRRCPVKSEVNQAAARVSVLAGHVCDGMVRCREEFFISCQLDFGEDETLQCALDLVHHERAAARRPCSTGLGEGCAVQLFEEGELILGEVHIRE
jgi:hypothetical protein